MSPTCFKIQAYW